MKGFRERGVVRGKSVRLARKKSLSLRSSPPELRSKGFAQQNIYVNPFEGVQDANEKEGNNDTQTTDVGGNLSKNKVVDNFRKVNNVPEVKNSDESSSKKKKARSKKKQKVPSVAAKSVHTKTKFCGNCPR